MGDSWRCYRIHGRARLLHEAVGLDLDVHAPNLEPGRALVDYVGGVMDTLDWSHGTHFTYLPIVYNDDCQVCDASSGFHQSQDK